MKFKNGPKKKTSAAPYQVQRSEYKRKLVPMQLNVTNAVILRSQLHYLNLFVLQKNTEMLKELKAKQVSLICAKLQESVFFLKPNKISAPQIAKIVRKAKTRSVTFGICLHSFLFSQR